MSISISVSMLYFYASVSYPGTDVEAEKLIIPQMFFSE